MPKLTLSFKGKPIQVYQFDTGIVTIGRDPDNTICIDSLAIAPKHIIIDIDHSEGPHLFQEDERFAVLVNDLKASAHSLKHGDIISLGKHTLVFAEDAQIPASIDPEPEPEPEPEANIFAQVPTHPEATLQLLNGNNIGRLIPLKQAMTRLGKPGKGVAVIARRRDGYFLSTLEGGDKITINNHSVGDQTLQLNHGDKLTIDRHRMLFCLDKLPNPDPEQPLST